jgi:peroxiredoxin Q/BCP
MPILKTGQPAPDFSLYDDKQKKHKLNDYRGQWLVIFFYPKDNTPGCTVEVCQFKNDYANLSAINTVILGMNTDNIESHQKFISQQQLPFPLLSDPTGAVCQAYGSLFKLGPIKFCKRHSIIISPTGNIAKIYRKVNPKTHSQQIIADLKQLQAN